MAKKTVYVSSTFEDLKQHRSAVKISLEKAGFDVACMEKYPAFDERPKDKCLADVAACDYYVLVLAWRYGHQPKEDNSKKLSITHLEYEEAQRREKPTYAFLLDPNHGWPMTAVDTNATSPRSKIGKFRSTIENAHGRQLFSSPDSLAKAVLEPILAEEQKHLSDGEKAKTQIRNDYVAWLRATCESVELLGLTLKESHNVRLGQVYVPAVTRRLNIEKDEKGLELHRMEFDLVLSRLEDESLYIPGAPGSGKSTFCRWLAYLAAGGAHPGHAIEAPDEFRETLPDKLVGRLPLLCQLREWAGREERLRGKGQWTRTQLEESLASWLDATQPGGLSAVFRDELGAGRCLIILDGVDEIPESLPGGHLPRRNFITGLADALPDWLERGNRVLFTSRPYGLNGGDRGRLRLNEAGLSDLPEDLQALFVRRWFAAADPARATEKAEGLLVHLAERHDELGELKQNPMLLTALCILWDQGQKLPQDFYQLYDALVSQVLYKRYLDPNEQYRARVRLEAVALGMHRGKAKDRATPAPEVDGEEIDHHLAKLSQSDLVTESGAADAAERREDLLSNSGLLLPRDGGRAAFYHLSFQEFLAAVRLRKTGETDESLQSHAATPAWRRTLRFLFCALADKDSPEAAIKAFAPLEAELNPDQLEQNPNPALLLADCLEVAHGRRWNLERFAAPLRVACDHALTHLNPPERFHLWRTLGRLGLDDRPGVGLRDGVPDIDWVDVPAGPFLYGDDKLSLELPTFRIARYPVTNAQFQAFIDDGGYEADTWWDGLAQRPEPVRSRWTEPNRPRERISWFEAVAFTRWLENRLREQGRLPDGWTIRLPTEAEWEKAARGTDGREYPWGHWAAGHANIYETWGNKGPHYLQQTAPAGLYPNGASPFGAEDMAGNLWEWCLNEYRQPSRTDIRGDASRVLRGGSWGFDQGCARCAYRGHYGTPDSRASFFGFRLLSVSPIP